MRKLLFGLLFLSVPVVSAAQSGPPVNGVEITLYRQGTTSPISAPVLTALSSWQCGLTPAPPPTGTVNNPNQMRVPQPDNTSLECLLVDPAVTSILGVLGYDPINVYFGRARYRNDIGLGPESPNSNFFSRTGTSPTASPDYLRWGRGQ